MVIGQAAIGGSLARIGVDQQTSVCRDEARARSHSGEWSSRSLSLVRKPSRGPAHFGRFEDRDRRRANEQMGIRPPPWALILRTIGDR